MAVKHLVIIIIVGVALLEPVDGWFFAKDIQKLGDRIEKTATKAFNGIKRAGCRALYGIGCPFAVKVIGKALLSNDSSQEDRMIAFGVSLGKKACHVKKDKCKRSVDMTEILIPFSDEMSDFDINLDKIITNDEFRFAVLTSVNLVEPDELREPFIFADFDGNGVLDSDEFKGAPFLFAHKPFIRRNVNNLRHIS
ncbi:uncharacterized protein LOC132753714 [Ruditapes philippinarum]|uniref:uncharacterized protein LOC132753714 n=1 Tax=Ruditapes philippinarum TaxID=129788 RepID=UPI00295C081C|nr:uncharacterized protein LOC132753714 [Ruditapes philippinarum]